MFIKTENANSHMLGTFQRLPESEGQSASALFVVHINMEELYSTLLASRVLTEALLRLNFVFFNVPRSAAITDLPPLWAPRLWQEVGYPPLSERGAELHLAAATLCCKAAADWALGSTPATQSWGQLEGIGQKGGKHS